MPKLIALYIDALDSNHIDPDVTPTLFEWQENGSVTELSTMFAFKGISAAMYGGVPPRESGVWMDFKVRTTPERKLGDRALSIASWLPNGLPRKGVVTAYERLIRNSRVTPHIVPANQRPYFEPHPQKSWTDERPLGEIPTIFDLFRQHDISFRTVGLAGGPQDRIKKKLRSVNEYSEDVILLKLTLLDHLGHKYGPGSAEHDDALREVDALLKSVVKENKNVLIFSDHGMQSVTDSVDVRSLLEVEAGLTTARDYVAFLNSTGALIRWLSDDVRVPAIEVLDSHSSLSILSERDFEDLEIGSTAAAFADDVVATKPGTVVSPDFYRHTPPPGMHGFVENPTGGPIAVAPGHELDNSGRLWDIAPTILEYLAINPPTQWVGRSLR